MWCDWYSGSGANRHSGWIRNGHAMDPEFWKERWRRNEIGFHQNAVNPHLREFWTRMSVAPGTPVFVPLAGKSLDMLWLAEQGHPVTGIEISPLAVEAFFAENKLSAERVIEGSLERWHHGDIELFCGDFFDLEPRHVAHCHAVFDRASLVALPPSLRRDYVVHMETLFDGRAPVLLVTMEYPEGQMQGPPFCVLEEEVRALYADRFDVQRQTVRDVLAEYPHLSERGISRLDEKVFVLRPRTE